MLKIARLIVICIYALPAALLRLLRIRFVALTHPDRIGHLCIEPDCFVKEGLLGLRPRFVAIFLIPESKASNRALLKLWSRRITTITSSIWCRLLTPLAHVPRVSFSMAPYAVAINDTATSPRILAQWGNRPPLLGISEEERKRGWRTLNELGMPLGAWYVCVHSREGEYSPRDEHLHSFRNSNIQSYRLAIQAIVERGGWCVRVGEASAKPLSPMKCVIDYARSASKSDWMDVFLCANCRFFLGNSSGLYLLSSAFGVPSALANLVPVSSSLPVAPGDIGTPKVLRRGANGELLTFTEILASPLGNFRFSGQYSEAGVIVEENTPEDIRDLALEMLARCEGSVTYTTEDEELQNRFRDLFRKGHYSFGAASRIGRDFLRKHADII